MRLPRIKRVHQPLALPGDRILIGLMQQGVAAEIQDDEEGGIARLIGLMDGTRTVDQVCAAFAETHPGVDEASAREVIEDLVAGGFVEDAGAPLPANLDEREAARYESARNFFAWIDTVPRDSPYEAQSKIKDAKVCLLGLGGTGTAVAAGLVSSGIGALHVADFDVVEESNLTRQLLYTEHDIGLPKVDRAVERLRAMNGRAKVSGDTVKADGPDGIAALMDGCDVFVLCADEPDPDIMFWTNEAALRTGTPWFVSLYTGPMAVVGGLVPRETGCWACLRRQEDRREFKAHSRSLTEERPNAVIAASANISGQLCALEVLYHLAGLPAQARGRVFHWNYAMWDHSYSIEIPHDADCPTCGAL
ncbi:HesA/MoeB/ThiF family protein [Actinomadura algeriensis]|uniref:Molybdopterin/thiamine biosynthesis adenylyltransferase n=1 Tax=Actinomadura algeriensis TaxID=1679523 RepID=A0ABR9JYD2_9ACTN|nr:ThiF family adenylyltransferase [Actinomadura algeriensis]MBE1535581.1 molybdopterin/thiamine biosynthesis adenylyltransferase [Actinomadura algeriensis]